MANELGLTGKGVEKVKIKGLDAAISKWETAKSERAEKLTAEIAAKQQVFALMKKHQDELPKNEAGFTIYDDGEKTYILEEKLKSKKHDSDQDDE